MNMEGAAQWRIRVIAAWPMAPEGDDQGVRAHEIAQRSMVQQSSVTAFLDPTIEHSYISRDFAQYMMGVDGLELAESASQKQLLGQVAVILCCDESEHNQTETFLLGDLGAVDMALSSRSWRSLEKQCGEITSSNIPLAHHSGAFSSRFLQALQDTEIHQQKLPEKMYFTAPDMSRWATSYKSTKKSVSSETTGSVSDSVYSETFIHTPYSTPEKMPSPGPSHTKICADTPLMTGNITFADLSARHYHVPDRISVEHNSLAHEHTPGHSQESVPDSDLEKEWQPNNDYAHEVWSWDPEKQNYFCRDRDEDDEWYWYPTQIM
jgi:hypothetical protein